MRVVTLALSTWESFLHNRLIVLILILAACVVLLMLFPLLAAKAALTVSNREAVEAMVLEEVSGVMSFVSGLGSVLAAWCAADALQSELRSGTVLAVTRSGWGWNPKPILVSRTFAGQLVVPALAFPFLPF